MDKEHHSAPAHIRRITVYASSSNALDERYYDAASRLGSTLARAGLEIVYGGGGVGLMRAMADSALAGGAHVHGVIPDFLNTVEHGHKNLSRLEVVTSMRERKHRMIAESDAVISLPGGCGTYEELLEALTLKRLGQFLGPIVLVNTNGYYDRFADLLRHAVNERFMSEAHLTMYSLVEEPEEAIHALHAAAEWSSAARKFAAVPKQ